eukprot:scaffold84724_cov30-Tisochrysis_lutea.AAC.3
MRISRVYPLAILNTRVVRHVCVCVVSAPHDVCLRAWSCCKPCAETASGVGTRSFPDNVPRGARVVPRSACNHAQVLLQLC